MINKLEDISKDQISKDKQMSMSQKEDEENEGSSRESILLSRRASCSGKGLGEKNKSLKSIILDNLRKVSQDDTKIVNSTQFNDIYYLWN